MSCWDTVADYALRSVGIGERLLPRADFTICQQVTLIGSGMIWNIYFGTLALLSGFFLATALAMAKAAHSPLLRKPAEWFIFVFRGSPLFIQFFFAYFLFLGLKGVFPVFSPLVDSVEVVRRGKVRRAKLYYLRERRGKSARIAEKVDRSTSND